MDCRTARAIALAWAIAVTASVQPATGGDEPQAPQGQVFRSGVELITVDVSVIDKTGNPVRSLRPDQFEVTVDGRPRRVVSAELVDYAPAGGPPPAGTVKELRRPTYSSNDASRAAVSVGRLIFLVIDQSSFRPGDARGAAEAASRFIERLQPQDRVGLVAFPPPGPSVAASRNHAAVRGTLRRIAGSGEPLVSSVGGLTVSLAEAIDIEAGDGMAFARVVRRECEGAKGPELKLCADRVEIQARDTAARVEHQTDATLNSLRRIVGEMAAIRERKTLVLISAGLPMADRSGGRLYRHAEIVSIARDAARVNANIYVLHIDSSFLDAFSASERRISETVSRDSAILATGLEDLAGASAGTLFRVVAGTDSAFDRVLQETAASYVLGIEPLESDRDGKAHAIKVAVRAPDVLVRSRREFVLPAAPATPDSRLAAALKAQRVVTDLPVGVSTHTLGPTPSGGMRVLVTANVGRAVAGPVEAQIGYVITDMAGDMAGNVVENKRLPMSRSSATGSASYVSVVGLKPGDYNLRLAVVDSSGRTGSVDHPFSVGPADGGSIVFSDLLLLDPARLPEEGFVAVADGRLRRHAVDAYLEIYARGSSSSEPTVSFGIADQAEGEPLIHARAEVSKKDGGRSVASARLDLTLLPPGDYVAVASVSDGKRRLGGRSQPLRIEAGALAAESDAGPPSAFPRVRFVAGESSGFVKAFKPVDVLAPETLAFFAGRLEAAEKPPGPVGVSSSVAALKSGQFDAALATLDDAESGRLSVAFLRGLALLGKGQLELAARQFREALRIADDFLPAAFYLGACYAAGGRDSEAVGAWQTALVTETDARIVYDVLADALLRLGEAEQAVEILNEARGRWPDDGAFVPRLAVAQAMLQRSGEALATLDSYLEGYQSDAEAAALAIRLIYEAHAAGHTLKSAASDRELAKKYGALYRAARGPNQALIDRWVAFIEKK